MLWLITRGWLVFDVHTYKIKQDRFHLLKLTAMVTFFNL